MDFGNPITDGSQIIIGPDGYLVMFDLSNQLLDEMLSVAVYLDAAQIADRVHDVVIAPSTRESVMGLPFDAGTVNVAWAVDGMHVLVFLAGVRYAFDADTRIAFYYRGGAGIVLATTDKQTIPLEAETLAVLLFEEGLRHSRGERVGFDLDEQIRSTLTSLGL